MVEETPFNHEWNRLQKTFWENVGSGVAIYSDSASHLSNATRTRQPSFFDQWLSDVDKCWQDHAQVTSTDIDALYQKVSSSSRFLFNFSETFSSTKQGETADVLIAQYLKEFTAKTSGQNHSEQKDSDVDCKKHRKEDTEEGTEEDTEEDTEESKSSSNDQLENNIDFNTFWKLPLENWQQQATFFSKQPRSFQSFSNLFGESVKHPEFSTAVEAYLLALQKYQRKFIDLFTTAAKQAIESLRLKRMDSEKLPTVEQIMTIWLEILETNYLALIAKDSYSRAYADVVNSWMLVLSKSNKPFTEFMQGNSASAYTKPESNSDGSDVK